MCGRYLFKQEKDDEVEAWLNELELQDASDLALNVVYPSQKTIVLKKDLKPMIARWGHARWDTKGVVINARSETVQTSPFFKEHIKTRRCVIKADGFYEWDKDKRKFLVKEKNDQPLYMAGIYDEENNFSIITDEVHTSFKDLHSRVPLFIPEKYVNQYLENGNTMLNDFRNLKQLELHWKDQSIQTSLF